MQANYEAFCDRMINRYEGGYGWDRADPGGPTKYGITCYDLAEFMGKHMDSMSGWAPIVRAMTLDTALQIYANKYASRSRFNELNSGCDCVVFDYLVNSGLNSIWMAQSVEGFPRSNVLNDVLLAKINGGSSTYFVDTMCDRRLAFLRGLRTWSVFGGGWASRVADLRQYCHRLISGQPPSPLPTPIVDQIALVKEAQAAYNVILNINPPLVVDGDEGPLTKAATHQFQVQFNVSPADGIIGPVTIAAIHAAHPTTARLMTHQDFWRPMGRASEGIFEFQFKEGTNGDQDK